MGSEYRLDVPGQHHHSLRSVPSGRNVNRHSGTENNLAEAEADWRSPWTVITSKQGCHPLPI